MIRKHFLTTFLLALFSVFSFNFFDLVLAETTEAPKIIKIKGIVSDPLDLYISAFNENRPYILSGKAVSQKLSKPVRIIDFLIKGKNNEALWNKSFPWENSFQKKDGSVVVNFQHNLKEIPLSGENTVQVKFIGEENEIVALDQKKISFPVYSDKTVSDISGVEIKKSEELVSVSVDFLNAGKKDDFYAQINVYKDSNREIQIKDLKTNAESLEASQKTTFTLDFPTPALPRFYIVDVQIFNKEEVPQTGLLSSGFLVDGLFALIEFGDISPKKFLTKGDTAFLKAKGTINSYINDLTIFISARSKEEDPKKDFQFFEKEFPLVIDKYRNFSETFSIPILSRTEQMWAVVQIRKNGKVLDERSVSSQKHVLPEGSLVDIIEAPFEVSDSSERGTAKVLLGGGIALLVFVLVIFFLVRFIKAKKMLSLLFLLSGIFFSGGLEAAAIVSPIFDYYRTTDLPVGEDFNLVTIQGEITGESGIFNVGEEYSTEFELIRDIDSQPLTVSGVNFLVEENDVFTFTFDATDLKLISEPLVLDSEYSLSRINSTETTTSTLIQIDVPLTFSVINEAPKARFELKNISGDELSDPFDPIVDFNELFKDGEDGGVNYNIEYPDYYKDNPAEFLTDVISEYFTNDTITAKIHCGTSNSRENIGNAQESDTLICDDGGPNLEEVEIRGNFCEDSDTCDTVGARIFKICNLLGNCSIASGVSDILVRNFDNAPPVIGSGELSNADNTNEKRVDDSVPFAALSNYILKVLDVYDQESIDNASLHSHACGIPTGAGMTDYDDYFYATTELVEGVPTEVCHPKQVSCAISSYQRGVREYTTDEGGSWEEVVSEDLSCAQQCGEDDTAIFCSDDDKIENGGDGVKRCCSSDACYNNFPLCFPFNLQ